MNWNDATEDLLQQILSRTPRPIRDETESQLKRAAESIAEEEGLSRVGVNTLVAAWIRSTPAAVRPDMGRQLEQLGLDPDEYSELLNES
ncbi:MAG: hypothetical protein HY820_29860 [Acidobacteria bacterium]|nr:hypothetical protein [Acidobacteriota bacterium]